MKNTKLTRKIISSLTVLAIVALMIFVFSLTSSAESTFEASWGESADSLTHQGTLDEAITAAENDPTVKYVRIEKDIVEDGNYIYITGGVFTLDLAGHTVTKNYYTISVYNEGTDVTIQDSVGGGSVINVEKGASAISAIGGAHVTILSGTYTGGYAVNIDSEYSSGTIKGGKFIATGARAVSNNGNLLIEGGEFSGGEWSSVCSGSSSVSTVITGGSFDKGYYGHIDYYGGVVDLSGYADPSGITIGPSVDAEGVIILPDAYKLYDESGAEVTSIKADCRYTVQVDGYVIPDPHFTGISLNTDSPAYDAATATFTVNEENFPILTLTGVRLDEYGSVHLGFWTDTSFFSMNIYNIGEITVNTDSEIVIKMSHEFLIDLTLRFGEILKIGLVNDGEILLDPINVRLAVEMPDYSEESKGKILILMSDTYGDGWNDASITITENLSTVGNVTIQSKERETYTTDYVEGSVYGFSWTKGGFDEECGFEIWINGELVFSVNNAETLEDSRIFYVSCDHRFDENHTCSVCTYTCGKDFSHTIDESHTCTVCGFSCGDDHDFDASVGKCLDCHFLCEHNFSGNVCSICAFEKQAELTLADGTTVTYAYLWEALLHEGLTGATVKLISDTVLEDPLPTLEKISDFTLDLNGKTIYSETKMFDVVDCTNVLFTDSVGGGKIIANVEADIVECPIVESRNSSITFKNIELGGKQAIVMPFESDMVFDNVKLSTWYFYVLFGGGSVDFTRFSAPAGIIMYNWLEEGVFNTTDHIKLPEGYTLITHDGLETNTLEITSYPIIIGKVGAPYTVSFDANGGQGEMQSVEAVCEFYLPESTFTREYHEFVGWSKSPDGEVLLYPCIVGEDLILYAIWENTHDHSFELKHDGEKHWEECVCGVKRNEEEHSFTNYTSNGDASCAQDGTKSAKCDKCDATDTKTDEGSRKTHEDKDNDHKCDVCTAEVTVCEDKDSDGKCDVCKKTLAVETTTVADITTEESDDVTTAKPIDATTPGDTVTNAPESTQTNAAGGDKNVREDGCASFGGIGAMALVVSFVSIFGAAYTIKRKY